jgi:hypothetical protein
MAAATIQRQVEPFTAADAVEATFNRKRVPTFDGDGNITGHTVSSSLQISFSVRDGAGGEVETFAYDVGPVPNNILAGAWAAFTPQEQADILSAAWAKFKADYKLNEV